MELYRSKKILNEEISKSEVKKIKQRVLTKKTKRNMLHVQVKYKAMTEKQ